MISGERDLTPDANPIAVVGMHRSGTSLVAGLLQRHGLWLGEEQDLMPPDPSNPDGYYENLSVVEINDKILDRFGGSWHTPPQLSEGWETAGVLADLGGRAAALRASLAGRRFGFKDPRASLTIPFWREIFPGLTFVVCLRNPLEVAQSLNRRNGIHREQALALWHRYYEAILQTTTPEERVMVEFEALCESPLPVAAALLERLEPGLADIDPETVQSMVRQPLRHHRWRERDLAAAGAPTEVIDLYRSLRGELPVLRGLPSVDGADDGAAREVRGLGTALAAWDLALRDLHIEVRDIAATVSKLEIELGFARSADLAGISAAVSHLCAQQLPELAAGVDRLGRAVLPLDERVSAVESRLEEVATEFASLRAVLAGSNGALAH